MAGRLIVLNGSGHTVYTEELQKNAIQLIVEAYNQHVAAPDFWQVAPDFAEGYEIVSDGPVAPEAIQEDQEYIALRPLVGG